MIKLIVEHRVSNIDVYGNRYWVSVLTSTLTGESVMFKTPHKSNTESLIGEVLNWKEVHAYTTKWGIRDFEKMAKTARINVCNDEWVTAWVEEHCGQGGA